MIQYGADRVDQADSAVLREYGLEPGGYALVVARPEPENSTLEIISAFSRKPRGIKLVVLGRYDAKTLPYHKQIFDAASNEVVFLGAIHEKNVVSALPGATNNGMPKGSMMKTVDATTTLTNAGSTITVPRHITVNSFLWVVGIFYTSTSLIMGDDRCMTIESIRYNVISGLAP